MPRGKPTTPARPPVPADRLLLEADLETWAGPRTFRAGRRDALLGRVEWLRLTPDGNGLEARVRDHRTVPHRLSVRCYGGELDSDCTCPDGAEPACKHAVAAVEALRFPLREAPRPANGKTRRSRKSGGKAPAAALAGFVVLGGGSERMLTRDERIAQAREEERGLRSQRSRSRRYKVELVTREGEPPRFAIEDRGGRREEVCLRGPRAERASCTCLEFAEDEIGTCVHVERARRWYLRKPKSIRRDLLSVWFSPREWTDRMPAPREELRIDAPDGVRPDGLQRWFTSEGWLRPQPDGTGFDAWLAGAIEAARLSALASGLRLDVDPILRSRFLGRSGGAATTDPAAIDGAWPEILSRIELKLHPYQEIGAQFLARHGRAFLADDMGLGKTVQSIAAALLLRRVHGAARTLVVCPASLKHQWAREIDKVCGEPAQVVEGPQASRLATYASWESGFLVLNYELLLRDLEVIREREPDLVILDEAQRIKNQGTKTARAVKQLQSRWAFVLTGTPLENRLAELHSLVEFLHRRALGPRWRLRPFHVVEDGQGRVLAYEGLEVLRKRLRGFFLRRDRKAVLDELPDRTDNLFWTGMSPLQRRPYRRQAARVAALVSQGRALSGADVQRLLSALTRMRMLCNAYAQDAWDLWEARLADRRPPDARELRAIGSPKLQEFRHVLEELLDESEEKIVVFSQWERMLRLARFATRDLLEHREIVSGVFHGGLRSSSRTRLLDNFRVDPQFRVLFSTDAGGLGLNLQDAASIVVHLEVPWNPAVLEQRVGRVHRMGQQRSVRVLHFVTRGAIEEKVRQVVEDKRALFDGLLTDGADQVVFDEQARLSFVNRLSDLIEDE